eukprot:TRINITY_DN254_c0_g2_i3.p1 TRINITY_DN254_c0_g2~~TRINITY_DN254_c0_g2_i3.p1  ORF type:complete len:865 (+),score=145.02 TRINITY_DN254_c0_g2_i3:39-2633(+)
MEATTIAVHFEDQRSELDISSSPITSLKDLLDRCRDLFRFPPDANLTVGFKDDGDDGQIKNDRFAKTVQAGDELEIRTGGASQVLNLRVVQPAGKEVSVLVMMTSTIQSTLDSSPGMFMHNESKAPSLIDKTFLDLLELFQCDRRELEKAVYIKQALPNQTQERRAQTKKEVAARLDECNNLRADLQKKVSEGAAAEEAETLKTVDKLKAKYSTFSDQRFDEMAKRGMDSMTTELTKLASILKVDLQALECDPPDASTRCQELFKLLYLPGVADPQLSHPVLDRLYHTLEQTFASSSERVAHEQGGYAGSSSVAHRVEACGGFMGFGAAGGHAHTEAWGRNDGFGQGQRRLSTQATVSKTQVFQLLSFIVERVTLDHGARNVLSQLGRLADTELQGQERLVKEFLDRYNQMFYLGVPQGPFSVGGSFEMYSTSSTQSVQDFTQLVTAAQQVNNNSWDVAVSGLTSSFAGSGGAAGVTNVQLNVGSGNDNQGNQTFAQVTTLVNIQGPTATNQHDVERSLMANINTGVLVPNSKPKRTLVFQDVALATEESMEPHERAAFVKGVERLNAFVHARTPVLTLDLGKGDAAVNTILFGKTGHGKSLLGSILLGWKPGDHPPFQSSDNTNSCTRGIARGRAGNLTVWDSQGLQDTTFSVLQLVENHKPFLEEFVKTLVSIGGDGVDALLYVINEARVDAKDGETAQMLAKFFQGGNIQQHTYLIFTRSDNPHRNKDQWLDTNCQNNPHFKAVYELVGCDPSHTIFIDSKNYVNTTRMEDRNSWAQQNNESLLRIQEMICTTRPNNPLTLDAVVLRASLQKHLADELEAANTIQAEIDRCQKVAADLQKTIDQGYKRPKQSSRGLFCVLA